MIFSNTEKILNGTIYQCEDRIEGDPYTPLAFAPVYVGKIGHEGGSDISFEGRCF